jgi:hypothetical protein
MREVGKPPLPLCGGRGGFGFDKGQKPAALAVSSKIQHFQYVIKICGKAKKILSNPIDLGQNFRNHSP